MPLRVDNGCIVFFLDQCHPKPNLHLDPGHNELKKTTSSGRNDGIHVAFSMGSLPKWIKISFINRLASQNKVCPDLCNLPSKPQPCDQQNVGARLPMALSWISWRMWRQNLQSICSKKQHPRIPPPPMSPEKWPFQRESSSSNQPFFKGELLVFGGVSALLSYDTNLILVP